MRLADLTGTRVVVWGAGREGVAARRVLSELPLASLTVVDDRGADGALQGEAARAALDAADVVVKSPGISRYDPRARALVDRGAVLTSGTALWMAEHSDRTIGVTGSKGKSTTSSLISHLLGGLGVPNVLAGNIGVPLLDAPPAQQYVVELSSYQSSDLDVSPRIAVITTLFPDHLDWHGSEQQYYRDKLNIARHDPQAVVYNATNATLRRLIDEQSPQNIRRPACVPDGFHVADGRFRDGGHDLFDRAVLPLLGDHNAANACVALTAVSAAGVDVLGRVDEVAGVLASFRPLAHRLETIAQLDGVAFVDDSLSTTPDAAVAALGAFSDGRVCLLVGGQDRGVDYGILADALAAQADRVVVVGMPDSGARIVARLASIAGLETALATDLDDAVRIATQRLSGTGGTVLLSPAAPSYGVFRNFEDRSAAFAAAVARLR